jgi:protein gp37
MAENSKISWTHHTFNPWIGCTKVSPACDHCYAENLMDTRMHVVQWGAGQPRKRTTEANWRHPLKWNAKAEAEGTRYRVFCASLADVFDNEVSDDWRGDLFRLIAQTPNLDWLLLTKRIGNAAHMIEQSMGKLDGWPPSWMTTRGPVMPNVWIGATICNQEEADRDIPKLLKTPAAKRFLSMEPLLGPVRLDSIKRKVHPDDDWTYFDDVLTGTYATKAGQFDGPAVDWVIVGGESGANARPMHPDWARSLRDQCTKAGVPFHFKQWGEWREPVHGEPFDTTMGRAQPTPAFIVAKAGTVHCFDNEQTSDGGKVMLRVGVKAAGRVLDGREWDEVPE